MNDPIILVGCALLLLAIQLGYRAGAWMRGRVADRELGMTTEALRRSYERQMRDLESRATGLEAERAKLERDVATKAQIIAKKSDASATVSLLAQIDRYRAANEDHVKRNHHLLEDLDAVRSELARETAARVALEIERSSPGLLARLFGRRLPVALSAPASGGALQREQGGVARLQAREHSS